MMTLRDIKPSMVDKTSCLYGVLDQGKHNTMSDSAGTGVELTPKTRKSIKQLRTLSQLLPGIGKNSKIYTSVIVAAENAANYRLNGRWRSANKKFYIIIATLIRSSNHVDRITVCNKSSMSCIEQGLVQVYEQICRISKMLMEIYSTVVNSTANGSATGILRINKIVSVKDKKAWSCFSSGFRSNKSSSTAVAARSSSVSNQDTVSNIRHSTSGNLLGDPCGSPPNSPENGSQHLFGRQNSLRCEEGELAIVDDAYPQGSSDCAQETPVEGPMHASSVEQWMSEICESLDGSTCVQEGVVSSPSILQRHRYSREGSSALNRFQ